MRQLFILIITFLISNAASSQTRENRQNLKFTSKSERIESAIGWKKDNITGQWIDNKNFIDSKKWSFHPSVIEQNFLWIQFATVDYEGDIYYVLIYENKSGMFKYPRIHKDWIEHDQLNYFIINKKDYLKLKSQLQSKKNKDINIISKMQGFIISNGAKPYTEETLLADITSSLISKGYSEYSFLLNSQSSEGKDVVRFRLPEGLYTAKSKPLMDEYFEISLNDFLKIFIE